MENLWIYLFFGVCTVAYLLTAWDKHQTVYERKNVPTVLLLIPSCLFGAFGTLCAMVLFNHKTRSKITGWLVPILVVVQLTLIVIWRTHL